MPRRMTRHFEKNRRGGEFVLVDAGPGTVRNADLLNLPSAGLTGVLMTHFHSHHIGDLGNSHNLIQ